jgi:predicted MFS family arabinose efflux permease
MRLALAGFLAIAVAFGPARNGFGLFLPDFREEFGFSVELSGFVASGLQVGYLVALAIVGFVAAKVGPRPLVIIGGLSAALGMTIVALAPNAPILAAGVVLAGTSAGWSWAPYNDAADREVPPHLRGRVLSIVSTGTTFGIVAAGLVALSAGTAWRPGWLAFAAAAFIATVANALVLPGSEHDPGGAEAARPTARTLGLRWFARTESAPLFIVAFSFGLVSAFYWSFAVDHVARFGGFSPSVGPLFFTVAGVAGFAGLFTSDVMARFGLRRVLVVTLLCLGISASLLGAVPTWSAAVFFSAALYGASVMLMSALLSVWSSTVFLEQPSTGFSATLLLFGIGSIVGPASLGAFAGEFGLGAAFLVSAALALLTIVAALVRPVKGQEHPSTREEGNRPIGRGDRGDRWV